MNDGGVQISQASILAGILIANAATILGTYISMRERLVKLEVKVDRLEYDMKNAWKKLKGETLTEGE